jgi:predicted lactoylglutathione lyase
MSTKIFVKLPVADLEKSKQFFAQLGYSFSPQFTDENAACMVISEEIYAMLLTHDHFRRFTPKTIVDATSSTEVLVALSCDSREGVDEIVNKAVAAGGQTFRDPQDYGFMYERSFQDPDGHIWEYVWMDPTAVQ